jgi:hypothetical protein
MPKNKGKKQNKGNKRGEPLDPSKAVDSDKWFTDRGMPTMKEFMEQDKKLRPWAYRNGKPIDDNGEFLDFDY